MARFLIAGSRNRYAPVRLIDHALGSLDSEQRLYTQHVIISGTAGGVDTSGEHWALSHKHEILYMPADWNKYGKKAGHIRNNEMVNVPPDFAFVLWDGESHGTKGMIKLLATKRIPHLVYVDYEGTYGLQEK